MSAAFKDEKADEKEEKEEEAIDMIHRKFGIDSIRIGTGKISSRKSREDVKCMLNHCVCIEVAV